jgi:hypothetical protein
MKGMYMMEVERAKSVGDEAVLYVLRLGGIILVIVVPNAPVHHNGVSLAMWWASGVAGHCVANRGAAVIRLIWDLKAV